MIYKARVADISGSRSITATFVYFDVNPLRLTWKQICDSKLYILGVKLLVNCGTHSVSADAGAELGEEGEG